MELHADLVCACGVVTLRNVERVEVLTGLAAIAPLHDAAWNVARVDTALPEPAERLVESDSARDDLIGGGGNLSRSASMKERRECRVNEYRGTRGTLRRRERYARQRGESVFSTGS